MPVITVTNLCKEFHLEAREPSSLKRELLNQVRWENKAPRNTFPALTDITFSVTKGETLGLIGPNGAGKSTLLKVLSGIYPATTGSYHIAGPIASLLELGTGFCPDLSGIENVFLNASLFGYSNREIAKLLPTILDFSELGPWIKEPIKHYSTGMLMRLGFSIATHLQREILLIDEIMTVGDMDFQIKCKQKIRELNDSGNTILFASHMLGDTLELCDRAVYLKSGKISAIGKPADVVDTYLSASTIDNQ